MLRGKGSIFGSLFGWGYVAARTLKDEYDGLQEQRAASSRKDAVRAWEAKYCDRELERHLRDYMSNPANSVLVQNELNAAAAEFISGGVSTDYIRVNAIDVLLANRGKISWTGSMWGYNAYRTSGNYLLKRDAYEFAEWIWRTLRKNGVEGLELLYHGSPGIVDGSYFWRGSEMDIGKERPPSRRPYSSIRNIEDL